MKELEEIFGIAIDNPENFVRALTHPSYTKDLNDDYIECYERLEFLGDAVLKLVISDILFKKFPTSTEGKMSKIRSIIVSDAMIAKISKDLGLNELIRVAKHEEKQGCKNLESVVACSFEALLGAFYLDGKFENIKEFININFEKYMEDIENHAENYNAKAVLQEYTQGIKQDRPEYIVKAESGPAHNRIFTVEVLWEGTVLACGVGKTKKEAEQNAALIACKNLGVIK